MLAHYRKTWEAVRNSTEPANRPAAEAGVASAYASAGLQPPERIMWCDSPLAIERSRQQLWRDFDPGRPVKSFVVDQVIRRAESELVEKVPARLRVAASRELEFDARYSTASATLSNTLDWEASGIRRTAFLRFNWLTRLLAGKKPSPYVEFSRSRWLQHEHIGALAKCAYFQEGGFAAEMSTLRGLWRIASNAGAMVPHERVCWLGERHDILSLDENCRLHSATGPSIRYPDGWSLYSWKGVTIPSWLIEKSTQIDKVRIDRERDPVIRHCMIDIMTPERFIATGSPSRFAEDATGILWRKQWLDWRDAWAAVEVVNGTPEPDGTRRHYFLQVPPDMRTPTEAVAWTYGMSPDQYSRLTRRT